jgi:tripartite-type tricarboxylate transporter receptor subunit TctC
LTSRRTLNARRAFLQVAAAAALAGNLPLAAFAQGGASAKMKIGTIGSGRVGSALGVSTARRSPQFPDVPTIAEAGVPGYEVTVWYGLCAPPGLPPELLARISADLIKAVSSPDTVQRLANAGVEAATNTPEQFAAFAVAEVAKWAKVVKESGATAD